MTMTSKIPNDFSRGSGKRMGITSKRRWGHRIRSRTLKRVSTFGLLIIAGCSLNCRNQLSLSPSLFARADVDDAANEKNVDVHSEVVETQSDSAENDKSNSAVDQNNDGIENDPQQTQHSKEQIHQQHPEQLPLTTEEQNVEELLTDNRLRAGPYPSYAAPKDKFQPEGHPPPTAQKNAEVNFNVPLEVDGGNNHGTDGISRFSTRPTLRPTFVATKDGNVEESSSPPMDITSGVQRELEHEMLKNGGNSKDGDETRNVVGSEDVDRENDEVPTDNDIQSNDNTPTMPPSIYQSHQSQEDEQEEASNDDEGTLSEMPSQMIPPRSYQSLFVPHQEEYDLLKFDPFSFSGAPLGGWGRATRSRLASLPIRLVSDFDGGMELLYGTDGSEGEEAIQENEKEDVESVESVESEGRDETGADSSSSSSSGSMISSTSKDIRPSKGPHFTIHDGTGQRYVCRVYAEDELVTFSQMDSMFRPAKTIWDEDLGGGSASVLSSTSKKETVGFGDGQVKIKKFSASLTLPGFNHDDEGDDVDPDDEDEKDNSKFQIIKTGDETLSEADLAKVSKLLKEMGLGDAAVDVRALLGGNGIGNIENGEAGGEIGGGNGEGAQNVDPNDFVAQIGMAAAVGAGVEGAAKVAASGALAGSAGGGSDGDAIASDKSPSSKATFPAQLTHHEITSLLAKLKGLCSQIHLGWWSYEWCHEDQVRQFHVEVSNNPPSKGGVKYQVKDITIVGYYSGETQITYPKGIYDGVLKEGVTFTIQADGKGGSSTSMKTHTPEDDKKFRHGHSTSEKGGIVHRYQQEKHTQLGHGGPIIKQTFVHGDMCDEVGFPREMTVELRCCTKEEIGHWLESKKQKPNDTTQKRNGGRHSHLEDTPLAVLVSVQESEEEICKYRSRVCTPVLCPKQVLETAQPIDKDSSSSSQKGSPMLKEKQRLKFGNNLVNQNQQDGLEGGGANDPIAKLLKSLLGTAAGAQNGEFKIFIANEETAESFEELVRQAEDGIDVTNSPQFKAVKEMLGKNNLGKKINELDIADILGVDDIAAKARRASMLKVKEGDSIREILKQTLGKRPCLLKNAGWWTYEFCHTKQIRQYHASQLIDPNTGFTKQVIETEHLLGIYDYSGNDVEDYPNEEEHLHVINATSSSVDLGIGRRGGVANTAGGGNRQNEKGKGGNGAVFVQEYMHGDVCDHEDVAESVIKGGNIVHGSVERSSTVRYSCGKMWELIDVKEDSTCHYVIDITVPELCEHPLFKAPVTKTQVVKCLPV